MRFLASILFLAVAATAQTPYDKWLNEDVVYLISPQERAGFQGLKSDQERDRFIEQFWLQRDPTLDTVENEFKEEHYRRIAYSNDRFGSTKAAGWKSDRGRMYIGYGPPDEIESHPSQGRESWRYRLIEGVGADVIVEFTDPKGTGEFPMTSDPKGK